jgi:3-oxoacyl-[acyl-carrier protein] reductase
MWLARLFVEYRMRNVIVTGATRGIGLAISQRLVDEGYRVIGIGRMQTENYELLQEQQKSGEAHFYSFDLNNFEDIHLLVSSIVRKFGNLYGLVNNAGVGLDGVLATMHARDIDRVLRINLQSPIYMTKFACRSMLVQREGRIINISSIIAKTGFSGLAVYAASKAGLEGFTRSLARELGRANITVNCIGPGYTETDMTAGLESNKLASIKRRSPLGLPTVEDVAGAASYLLGPDGVRITGTVLTVDAGSTA